MALEFAADESESAAYPLPLAACCRGRRGRPGQLVIDWEPLVHALLADRAAGVSVGCLSARFHNALAEMAVAVAPPSPPRKSRRAHRRLFSKRPADRRLRARLSAAGFQVYTHYHVPPGDGGLALGQVFLALQQPEGFFHVSGNSR